MSVILNTKDIRFTDTKINILLRGGVVSRDDLRNSKNSIIEMNDVPFGVAKRINDITAIDVKEDKELNNWYRIGCGDTEELVAVYTKKTEANEIEVSFACDYDCSDIQAPDGMKEALHMLQDAIEEGADAAGMDTTTFVVGKLNELNSDKRTILEDGVTVSEEIEIKHTYEPEESKDADEVDEESSDEEEETPAEETTPNTPSHPQQNNNNNVYRRQVNNKKRRH